MLTHPIEIKFFKKMPKNVGLLLDVGHLKVSAKTQGFSTKKAMINLKPFIKGYHLSENSGFADSNRAISKKILVHTVFKKKY